MGQKPYSRRELNRRALAWGGRNKGLLFLAAGFIMASIVGSTMVMISVVPESGLRWYLLGGLHVGAVCVFAGSLRAMFMALDGRAIHHLRGAWGEENTTETLKSARRRGVIWGWVDGFVLESGDVDHIVVTRRGGVVTIDSKWRNALFEGEPRSFIPSARRSAVRTRALVRAAAMTRRGAAPTIDSPAKSAVVVWGAEQSAMPPSVTIDGIDLVAGRNVRDWLESLDGEPIDRRTAKILLKDLRNFRDVLAASALDADSAQGVAVTAPR